MKKKFKKIKNSILIDKDLELSRQNGGTFCCGGGKKKC